MTDLVTAEAGVRQLHARYVDAVFRKDYPAFGDCWTEDAEWRIRGHVYRGRSEICAFLARAMDNFHRVIMTFRTPIIDLRPDGAYCRTYVTEQNGFKDGRPGSTIGMYYEKAVEQDGRWRRAWALFQLHYIGPADLTGSFFEHPDYGPPPGFPPPDALPANNSGIKA
jgi:ketosteroid isomerase-like protein